ncbi:triokinase/FMN cyclase isoform X2 [Clarias gariepinus]|uniref:triokinase/FMN cyclase isoform X2 n=1 Tax=Clarias gariepinus TaxID=13013 RepID=UPI00234D2136|nr:triokinase/FMN cyclase isoform X2 [Clarias gariepinus]
MEVRRKLLNSVDHCVDEALEGIVSSNGGLMLLRGHRVVLRSDLHNLKGKVALISGGGSGHEPAHAGYIGRGMLSAAVAGSVFSSPPPGSILAAIMTLWQSGTSGVLLLVKNYTGDRLNFGLAAEKARAQGVPVDMVIVADDCAFTHPSKAGRRGLCGTVFIHKLAGALAEECCPLDMIVAKVSKAAKNIGTLGVSLSPCSVPGCLPTFELMPGDMELGLGIHGEPGIKKSKMASADEVVKTMIDHMTDHTSQSHLPLKSVGRGVQVARVMSGLFMTSLEMAGMSLSVMTVDEEILRLFDAKTSAPAWPNLSAECLSGRNLYVEPTARPAAAETRSKQGPFSSVAYLVLESICKALLQRKDELNALDRAAGDGDCGSTHALAAAAIEQWIQTNTIPGSPCLLLTALAGMAEERMGGSSGALYSLFLTAAAPHLRESCDGKDWAKALQAGTEAMKRYGGAAPGDRTMLDALCPAVDELMKLSTASPGGHIAVLQAAVEKAELGAQSTRDLTAKAGRASYIASERLTQPDPGAVAVAAIFRAVIDTLKGKDQ